MNTKIFHLSLYIAVTAISAHASVTFSGNYSSNLKQTDGSTNIVVGTRYILVADLTGNGFGASTNFSIAAGTDFNSGTLFGGDEIVQSSFIPTLPGRAATAVSNASFDSAPYAGKQFGLVWFENLTSSNSTVSNGDKYGFARDASWVFPSTPGTFAFAASGGDFIQLTSPGGTSLTAGVAVPEPSRIILFGLSFMFLIMRRRR